MSEILQSSALAVVEVDSLATLTNRNVEKITEEDRKKTILFLRAQRASWEEAEAAPKKKAGSLKSLLSPSDLFG